MNKNNKTGVPRSHPDYHKLWRKKNIDKCRINERNYHKRHPEKYQEKIKRNSLRMRKYRKAHPEARVREQYGKEAAEFWLKYLSEGCKKCGTHKNLTLHHIDRNNKNNKPENLVILCRRHHTEVERYYDKEDRIILVKWFNSWIHQVSSTV